MTETVYPIDGVLDLHQFRPADARAVVADYLDACRERGVLEVRIIHGKGTGALRELVHGLLARRTDVMGFKLTADGSGWGATIVRLRPDAEADPEARRPPPAGPGPRAG